MARVLTREVVRFNVLLDRGTEPVDVLVAALDAVPEGVDAKHDARRLHGDVAYVTIRLPRGVVVDEATMRRAVGRWGVDAWQWRGGW